MAGRGGPISGLVIPAWRGERRCGRWRVTLRTTCLSASGTWHSLRKDMEFRYNSGAGGETFNCMELPNGVFQYKLDN